MCRTGTNIRKRKDGRWEGRYIKGRGVDGRARYASVYAHSCCEVQQKVKDAVAARIACIETSPLISFSTLCEEFLSARSLTCKTSSIALYRSIIDNHLLPGLKNCKVENITLSVLEDFVFEQMRTGRLDGKGGLSAQTVSSALSLLRQILRYAQIMHHLKLIDVSTVHVPKQPHTTVKTLNNSDWNKLFLCLVDHITPQKLGILISMDTGLRIGEICALRYSDIDLEQAELHVTHTLKRISIPGDQADGRKTELILDTPKTEYSRRTVPVSTSLLKKLRQSRLSAESADSFVVSGTSHMIEPHVLLRDYQNILNECGISHFTFHALRHSFATRSIGLGFDVKTLSTILGHSSVKITLECYMHPTTQAKRELIEKISNSSPWHE